ncbi:MAG: hypothetical protein ACLTZT_14140 [Butyricimonas faecalis]
MNWATLSTSIRASLIDIKNNGMGLSVIHATSTMLPFLPYDQMVDSDGNRVDYYRYLKDFVDEKESQGYKNWKYNYLDELDNKDDRRKEQAITMTVGLNVPIPGKG